MVKCELCGCEGGFYKDKDGVGTLVLCEGCMEDVKRLYSLAVEDDAAAYKKFKMDFLQDFAGTKGVKKIVGIADNKRAKHMTDGKKTDDSNWCNAESPAENNAPEVKVKKQPVGGVAYDSFMPFKLLLATVFAVLAIFLPCFGLAVAILATNMSYEIPLEFSQVDVKRARRLSAIAYWVNIIEIVISVIAGIITLIVMACNW